MQYCAREDVDKLFAKLKPIVVDAKDGLEQMLHKIEEFESNE